MIEAIRIDALVKRFGHVRALDGLDLVVRTGEVHGLLGPKGAGKTTAIRVLLGLMRADGGSAFVLGSDPWKRATSLRRRLAYVPGNVVLWPGLTGGEVIDLLGRLRGGFNPGRLADLLERFELDPRRKCRTYSKGNRQKVALVAALASDVELLLLDEPISGLDRRMEEVFRQVVREERDSGRTVLLSSRTLAQVEMLCDRITIIRDGHTVDSGTPCRLRHLSRTSIDAELAGPATGLTGLWGVHDVKTDGSRVRFDVDTDQLDTVLRHLTSAGVRSMICRPSSIEELSAQCDEPKVCLTARRSRAAVTPGHSM